MFFFIKQTTFNMIAIPAKRWHVKREARVLSKAHFSLHSVQPYDIALIICLTVMFSIVLTRVAYTQSADIYSIHILPFARTDTLISDVHCYATNDTAFSLVILTLIRLKKTGSILCKLLNITKTSVWSPRKLFVSSVVKLCCFRRFSKLLCI